MRARRGPSSVLSAAALTILLLTGCTQAPPVTRDHLRTPSPSTTVGASTDLTDAPTDEPADLTAIRRAAGIADCPTSDADPPAVDGGLPDVTLDCLGGGREVRLAGLRGRPMVLNVWGSWCGPCRQEAPVLAEVSSLNTTELLFLGVDYSDSPRAAITFARASAWTFPQVEDRALVLRGALPLAGVPSTIFVRADGTVAYRLVAPLTSADQLRQLVREHLGVTL